MLPPIDNKTFDKGFCWGEHRATITDGDRLRLNKEIIEVLIKNKVNELWRFPDPTGSRFILCPPQHYTTYLKTAKDNLPRDMDQEKAYRKYIFSGKLARLNKYNRIRITKICLNEAQLTSGNQVVIYGVCLWWEVWRDDKWNGATHKDKQ